MKGKLKTRTAKVQENGNGHGTRMSLGKKFPTMLTIKCTYKMQEYVKRKGFDRTPKLSGAEYVRQMLFTPGWEKENDRLAEIQGPMENLSTGD